MDSSVFSSTVQDRPTSLVIDFNEIILDFLSEPDAAVQDQLKELNNASKVYMSFIGLYPCVIRCDILVKGASTRKRLGGQAQVFL